ncbi:hypothetical protein [Paenibacillus sp. SI8]|uniref:hypothetical protein n=1 Tax=unclassified Paenibacillus TaxID=185978 RepID=UPI003467D4AF
MSFDIEIATTIQKYLYEVKGEQLGIEEILTRPRWKRVWIWWQALEHFEGKPKPALTVEEVKVIYGD